MPLPSMAIITPSFFSCSERGSPTLMKFTLAELPSRLGTRSTRALESGLSLLQYSGTRLSTSMNTRMPFSCEALSSICGCSSSTCPATTPPTRTSLPLFRPATPSVVVKSIP